MYESHVTVKDISDKEFLSICKRIHVKPVIIENDTGSGVRQLMTAKFHKNDYTDAISEMNLIAASFESVVRRKLEKIIRKNQSLGAYLYLEFHLKYMVPKDSVAAFVKEVVELGGHSSTNVLKADAGTDKAYVFVTARDEAVYNKLVENLAYEKVHSIRECVVFDDNPSIDNNWTECKVCLLKRY